MPEIAGIKKSSFKTKVSRKKVLSSKPGNRTLPNIHHVRDDVLPRLSSSPAPPAPPSGPSLKQFFVIAARERRTRKRKPAAQLLSAPSLGSGRRSRPDRRDQDDDQLGHPHLLQAARQPLLGGHGIERDGRIRAELLQRRGRRALRERRRRWFGKREVFSDLPRPGPDERSHEHAEMHRKPDGKSIKRVLRYSPFRGTEYR